MRISMVPMRLSMLSFAVLLSLCDQEPDTTSYWFCENRVVQVDKKLAGGCTINLRNNNVPVSAEFSSLNITITGGTIKVTKPLVSTKATVFEFDVLAGVSGHQNLTAAPAMQLQNFKITAFDEPDTTTKMVCPKTVGLGEDIKCEITPMAKGAPVWSYNRFVMDGTAPGGADGAYKLAWRWEGISPPAGSPKSDGSDVGNHFVAWGTAPHSATYSVTNGFSTDPDTVHVTTGADNTSTITCPSDIMTFTCEQPVTQSTPCKSGTLLCTVDARSKGSPVSVPAEAFTLGGLGGAAKFGALAPPVSTHFEFSVQLQVAHAKSLYSGVYNVSILGPEGPGFEVYVTALPDTTSKLSCEKRVAVGGQVVCSITPRVLGKSVWTTPDVWSLSALDDKGNKTGSFSGLVPSDPAQRFTFKYTATTNASQTRALLNDGHSPVFEMKVVKTQIPDETSTLTCGVEHTPKGTPSVAPGARIQCLVTPKLKGSVVMAKADAFNLTDNGAGGVFSTMNNTAGNRFAFSYTAPATDGKVSICDKLSCTEIVVSKHTTPAPGPGPDTTTITAPGGGDKPSKGMSAWVVVVIIAVVLVVCVGVVCYRRSQNRKSGYERYIEEDAGAGNYEAPVLGAVQ